MFDKKRMHDTLSPIQTMRKWFRIINLPGWILAGLLFWLSSRPGTPHGWLIPPWDKVAHFCAYAALAMTLSLWVRGSRWVSKPWRYLGIVWGISMLFGITDEFHQSFVPGRHPSATDVLVFDNLGALIALLIHYWKYGRRDGDKE